MFPVLTDRTWLWAAAALYAAGFLQGTVALMRHGRPSGGATSVLILLGYLVQWIGLGVRGRAVGGCPLGNPFEVYQFTAWSAVTLYLVVGATFRLSMLGYFSACLASTLTLTSLVIPAWDATQRTRIFGNNPWIEFHAALAVFSYGVFALLALTSIMFLLRNYSLKSKQLGGWFSFLPSIRDLDHMGVRLLGTGTTILAVALLVGSIHWLRDTSMVQSTKILVTVAVWAAAAIALTLRLRGLLLSKRFAWTCLILFFAAMLSLVAVERSRHAVAHAAFLRPASGAVSAP
ncbi:MAG: cytochrome c biogenesis protein CcsA [Verrucomicrobia bacterium]|nr:cytochrome c biogenesis protein CcsA [Verrucomicrobiota bacterium]